MLLFSALAIPALVVLPDGRAARIFKSDEAVSNYLVTRVAQLANDAINAKGSFSMSIGSGTTVTPLSGLAGNVDFSKVHIFFGNERTEGDAAGKCFDFATECGFIANCEIPSANIHRVPSLSAEEAAAAYEAELRAMPDAIVGTNARSGLPSLDLCLLGSGADGHCASLYPESPQVVCSPGSERVVLPADGKGGVTLSLDAIGSACNVILSAGKPTQSDMVRKCLGWSNAATNTKLPAGSPCARGRRERAPRRRPHP